MREQPAVHEPAVEGNKYAGEVEPFIGGRVTYMAPKPLPTLQGAYGPHIGTLNDVYMDFGLGTPEVFAWQLTLGGPFSAFVFFSFGSSFFALIVGLTYDPSNSFDFAKDAFFGLLPYANRIGGGAFIFTMIIWLYQHNKYSEVIPTRFNRQRREICFKPRNETEPVIVPWESVTAWSIEAQGATQYGVHRQYGMGLGFSHEASGERFVLEFLCMGPLALSHWEAIRGYMEYEIHDLHAIQANPDLRQPNDPPWEGLHTLRRARARLHEEIRNKQTGLLFAFGWYLFHVMTLWGLPFWLCEWENRRLQRLGPKALPEAMSEWSQPLPPEQWAKPSAELLRMSEQVRALAKRDPHRPISEIHAQVSLAAMVSSKTSTRKGKR